MGSSLRDFDGVDDERPRDLPSWSATCHRWRREIAILSLFLLVVGVYYVGIKGDLRSAINRWRPIVLAMGEGQDIYRSDGFPTPPIMVLILTPFCCLSGHGAMASWFLVKAVLVLVVVMGLLRLLEQRRPVPRWSVAIGLLIAIRPIMGDLLHGNVNLWILALVSASLLCFRQWRDGWGGILMGCAIACKLTPALFVVYFAWKRAWRMVGWTIVGVALWLIVIPGALIGDARNRELLAHWGDAMVWPYVANGEVETGPANQSASALIYRWLGAGDPMIARVVSSAVTLGIVVLMAWSCRRVIRRRTDETWLHEWGIVMLAMLLVSERSWKHHFVWLLPISLVLACWAGQHWNEPAWRTRSRLVVGLLGSALLCMLATSQDFVRPVAGERGADWVQQQGAYVWGAIVLWLAHVVVLGSSWQDLATGERDGRSSEALLTRSAPSVTPLGRSAERFGRSTVGVVS